MKLVVLALALVVCASAHQFTDAEINEYKQYLDTYGKTYGLEETMERLPVFLDNMKTIREHNAKGDTWWMGQSLYTDWTWDEFKTFYGLDAPQECSATGPFYVPSGETNEEAVDWRKQGIVSPVKDQGHCGSCWAFSTIGAVEAHDRLYNKRELFFSEQQLVDCAGGFDNHGCNGGLPSQAFEYLTYAGGAMQEKDYPYKAHDEACHFHPDMASVKLDHAVNITEGAENDLVDAVAKQGPVSIAYQVVSDFMHYKGGVYRSDRCENTPDKVNHAVLAVGFDHDKHSDLDYFIVKNSWSTHWGMDGYFEIQRGVNMCGLAVCASYPKLA